MASISLDSSVNKFRSPSSENDAMEGAATCWGSRGDGTKAEALETETTSATVETADVHRNMVRQLQLHRQSTGTLSLGMFLTRIMGAPWQQEHFD